MKRSNIRTRSIALAFIAVLNIAHAQNLLINGSFESPGTTDDGLTKAYGAGNTSLPGWNFSGNGNILLHHTPALGNAIGQTFNFSHHGNFYLDLSGSTSFHATIYQDFPTTPSAEYQLSFYIGGAVASPSRRDASILVDVIGATTLVHASYFAPLPKTNIDWMLVTIIFVADSATTRLAFVDQLFGDDNMSFVDSVSVIRRSMPSLQIATLQPGQFSIAFQTTAGLSYQLRSSIDLQTWTDVGLPISGDGNVKSVLQLTSQPRQFWKLFWPDP